jgi:hypothetical protein
MSTPEKETGLKTPVYTRNANKRYYEKKKETDQEYVDKLRETSREWKKEHRDEHNKYMREYRARKKAEYGTNEKQSLEESKKDGMLE